MADDGPLGRARRALLDAKAAQAQKDTPAHRQAVADAMTHLDYLLDTLPLGGAQAPPPHTPGTPGAHRPGVSVSITSEGERVVSDLLEDGCGSTTAQQDVGSGDEQ